MGKHAKHASENKIVYLETEEEQNPGIVIHKFFSLSLLSGHLKMLEEWRNHVAFGRGFTKKINPANLLYQYEQTIKLLEAGWILKDKKTEILAHNLAIELRNIFQIYNLCDYRRILKTWLYDALSSSFDEDSLTKKEVITTYEQLVKLFKAMAEMDKRYKLLSSIEQNICKNNL